MIKYVITNDKDAERYIKSLNNYDDARHWVINHLDMSKQWTIKTYAEDLKNYLSTKTKKELINLYIERVIN
jgi:hypothetical protein